MLLLIKEKIKFIVEFLLVQTIVNYPGSFIPFFLYLLFSISLNYLHLLFPKLTSFFILLYLLVTDLCLLSLFFLKHSLFILACKSFLKFLTADLTFLNLFSLLQKPISELSIKLIFHDNSLLLIEWRYNFELFFEALAKQKNIKTTEKRRM